MENQNLETNRNNQKDEIKEIIFLYYALSFVVLLVCLVAVISLGKGRREYWDKLEWAQSNLENGNYEAALEYFEELIIEYPKFPDGYLGLADAAEEIAKQKIEQEKYEEAIEDYSKAIDILDAGVKSITTNYERSEIAEKYSKIYNARTETQMLLYEQASTGHKDNTDEDMADMDSKDGQSNVNPEDWQTNGGDYYQACAFRNSSKFYIISASGGVILLDNYGKVGAMDYNGNLVVPFEFDDVENSAIPPTENGNFVLSKDGVNYLFDAGGQTLASSKDEIIAAKDYYLVNRIIGAGYDDSGNLINCRGIETEYYNYAGNKVITTRREYYEAKYHSPNAIVDENGNMILYQNFDVSQEYDLEEEEQKLQKELIDSRSFLYIKLNSLQGDDSIELSNLYVEISAVVREQYGYLSPDGEVTWMEETDCPSYRVYEIYKKFTKDTAGNIIEEKEFQTGYRITASYDRIGNMQKDYSLETTVDCKDLVNSFYRMKSLSENDVNIDMTSVFFADGKLHVGATGEYLDIAEFIDGYSYTWVNGSQYANDGTKMILLTSKHDLLVDFAQLDENDLPKLLASYEHLHMSNNDKWLVNTNNKWGYADHDGNIIELYQDASEFADGYAGIIKANTGYIVDEDLNIVAEIGPASSTYNVGDLIAFNTMDYDTLYYKYEH